MRRWFSSAAFPVHRHSAPQVALDAGLIALAYFLAYRLRFDGAGGVPALYHDLFVRTLGFAVIGSVAILALFGVYRHWMRYSSQSEYLRIAQASLACVLALVAYVVVVQPKLLFAPPRGFVSVNVADRRARPLRPAHARLPRRRALHRARRLRAAAARLARCARTPARS